MKNEQGRCPGFRGNIHHVYMERNHSEPEILIL